MSAWINFLRPKNVPTVQNATDTNTLFGKRTMVLSSTPKIRLVFMGTPLSSAILLESLLATGYQVVGVVTKADMKAGRKQELTESEVKKVATENNLPLLQPLKMDADTAKALHDFKPDLIVVAAYGKILPKSILEIPRYGCINFHTSLLPKWRGASPIQNAILAGETKTGVTIMKMDEGMDTGDILAQIAVSIAPDDTNATLSEKLFSAGKDLLLETIPLFISGEISPKKQDSTGVTLCQLIEREDGHIGWTDDAESIYNRYRALTPWPGIFSLWKKEDNLLRLKLTSLSFQKQPPQNAHSLGEVFEIGEKVGVQTGNGVIFLEEVQLEGKSPVPIKDFLLGNGSLLGTLLQ